MIWRRIKVKAHLFTTVAGFWLIFSALALFDWLDMRRHPTDTNALPNLIVWILHLLLIAAAYHFHRTETPREILWIGESTQTVEALFEPSDLSACLWSCLQRLAALVDSGLSGAEVDQVQQMAEEALLVGQSERTFPIVYRGRRNTLVLSVSPSEEEPDLLSVWFTTHPDLAQEIKQEI